MKKLITFVTMLVFVFSLSISVVNPTEAKTIKKIVSKKVISKVKVKKVVKKTIAPIIKPIDTITPIPTPMVVKTVVCQSRQLGILGWGINSNVKISYITGQGKTGAFSALGQVVFDDPLSLGSYVGITKNAVKYGIGIGAVYGKDINDNDIKAIPIYGDVIVDLPVSLVKGFDTYATGGLNYVVYGTDRVSGNYGAQIALGVSHDYGIGIGKTSVELGLGAVRCGSDNLRSAKGIVLSVSQPIII